MENELLGEESPAKMKDEPEGADEDIEALRSQVGELQEQVRKLELRKAILEGTAELLGKDPGVDPNMLTNREKALLVDSLRGKYSLKELLAAVSMAKSSYEYASSALSRPEADGRRALREAVVKAFGDSCIPSSFCRHILLSNFDSRIGHADRPFISLGFPSPASTRSPSCSYCR